MSINNGKWASTFSAVFQRPLKLCQYPQLNFADTVIYFGARGEIILSNLNEDQEKCVSSSVHIQRFSLFNQHFIISDLQQGLKQLSLKKYL